CCTRWSAASHRSSPGATSDSSRRRSCREGPSHQEGPPPVPRPGAHVASPAGAPRAVWAPAATGGTAVQMDDMILVSIDDHMIEPPDLFERHVPEKWRDQAPTVVRNEQGVDEWHFQGTATSTPFGMAATVGWPREEWGFNPGCYAELRPGCFDVHQRVRDMDANGVLASLNFPTMAGWSARTFNEGEDKDVALVMMQAYNDWAIDEWCASYPGRLIPLGIVPNWD